MHFWSRKLHCRVRCRTRNPRHCKRAKNSRSSNKNPDFLYHLDGLLLTALAYLLSQHLQGISIDKKIKAISAAKNIHVATLEHDSVTSLHAVPAGNSSQSHFDVSPPPILIHSSLPLHNVATINEMACLLTYE